MSFPWDKNSYDYTLNLKNKIILEKYTIEGKLVRAKYTKVETEYKQLDAKDRVLLMSLSSSGFQQISSAEKFTK